MIYFKNIFYKKKSFLSRINYVSENYLMIINLFNTQEYCTLIHLQQPLNPLNTFQSFFQVHFSML